MTDDTLRRLVDNARLEMGPEVFRQFSDDLAGKKPKRQRTMTCALCNGTGFDGFLDAPCAPCDATGKF